MSNAEFIPGFPVLVQTILWDSGQDAMDDFEKQWKIVFNPAYTFYITAWEGPNDPDDYGFLTISGGVAVWGRNFDTPPAMGATVFIVDFYIGGN
jgi:hypothetical protein